MKKNIFKWSVCGIVILAILLLGIYCVKRINEIKNVEETIQIFHDFCAFSINNNHEFCSKSLPKQPVIILFVNPECDFCLAELKELKENQSKLQDISILLISAVPLNQAIIFYSNQNLNQFNNIQFLVDEDFNISNHFDIRTIPTVFVYNANKELTFKHKGEIKTETLIRYLSKE
jgi:thiol-disulfide isomerase/thioredoxin